MNISKYIKLQKGKKIKVFNTSYGPCNMRQIADIKMATALEDKLLIEFIEEWDKIRNIVLGTYKTEYYKKIIIGPKDSPNSYFKDFKLYIGFIEDNIENKNPLCWSEKTFNKMILNRKTFQKFI